MAENLTSQRGDLPLYEADYSSGWRVWMVMREGYFICTCHAAGINSDDDGQQAAELIAYLLNEHLHHSASVSEEERSPHRG